MTAANTCCTIGAVVIGGGLYQVHPALACLWGGALLVACGVAIHRREAKKDKPQ